MNLRGKTLSVAVALLVLASLGTGTASASKFTVAVPAAETASLTATAVSGASTSFKTDFSTITCGAATWTGEMKTGDEAITFDPVYGQCFFGFLTPVTVDMNGCDYLLQAKGELNYSCVLGGHITLTAPECKITIEPNVAFPKLEFTEAFNEKTQVVDLTITQQVQFNYLEEGVKCKNPKKLTVGEMTGKMTMNATHIVIKNGVEYLYDVALGWDK